MTITIGHRKRKFSSLAAFFFFVFLFLFSTRSFFEIVIFLGSRVPSVEGRSSDKRTCAVGLILRVPCSRERERAGERKVALICIRELVFAAAALEDASATQRALCRCCDINHYCFVFVFLFFACINI